MNRQGTYTRDLRDRAIYLYTVEKFGCDYIGREVGFSQFTVLKNLKKDGVQIRTPQEAYALRVAPTSEERKVKDATRKSKSNKSHREKATEKNQEFILQFLLGQQCVDCGYDNFIALEFDHRDPAEKSFTISRFLSRSSCSEEAHSRLREEIKKCDVVCSNCHTIRTAKKFGSWRLRYAGDQRP